MTRAQRLDHLQAASGGTWVEVLHGAVDAHEVGFFTKQALQAALGRPVHVDIAPNDVHLISAKEIATALISLSIAHPGARLSTVSFEWFPHGDPADATAGIDRSGDGAHLRFNLWHFSLDHRVEYIRTLLANNLDEAYTVTQALAGGALAAVHEFGHVLDFTASVASDKRFTSALMSEYRNPEWADRRSVPGMSESLWTELDRTSGVSAKDAAEAFAKDYRNPIHALDKGKKPDAETTLAFEEFKNHWGMLYWKIKDQISTYAGTNRTETAAEAFSAITFGRLATPVNQAIHGRLMRALGHPPDHRASDLPRQLAAVREGHHRDAVLGLDAQRWGSENERAEMRAAWERALDAAGRQQWTAPTPEERFTAAESALPGGDWQRAMRDAPDVAAVEKLTRNLMQASFGAPVTVDMASDRDTHLLSAKEAGAALVTLARTYPRTRLESVTFDDFTDEPDKIARTTSLYRTKARMSINLRYLTEAGRMELTDHLMRGWVDGESVLPPSLGAAGPVVREFGRAVSDTAHHELRDRDTQTREAPNPAWAAPKTVAREPHSPAGLHEAPHDRGLASELGRAAGRADRRTAVKQAKDYAKQGMRQLTAKLRHSSAVAEQTPLNHGFGPHYHKIKDHVTHTALTHPRQLVAEAFARATFFRDVNAVNRIAHGRLMRALGEAPNKRAGDLRSTVAEVTARHDDNARIGLDHRPELSAEQRDYFRRAWRVAVSREPAAPNAPAPRSVDTPTDRPPPAPNRALGLFRRRGHGLERGKEK